MRNISNNFNKQPIVQPKTDPKVGDKRITDISPLGAKKQKTSGYEQLFNDQAPPAATPTNTPTKPPPVKKVVPKPPAQNLPTPLSLSPENSPKPGLIVPPKVIPASPAGPRPVPPVKPHGIPIQGNPVKITKPISEIPAPSTENKPPLPQPPLRRSDGAMVPPKPITTTNITGSEFTLVKREIDILQNEISRITKDRELATQFQQDQINFMKAQLSNSETERSKLLAELWKRDEQNKIQIDKLTEKIERLQTQLQEKEREIQDYEKSKNKSPIRPLSNYSSPESTEEDLCSQDSFRALCRTQQQKKMNTKQQVTQQQQSEEDEDYSFICQKKVELISDLLHRSNAEIISFFNVFTLGSSIQEELQNKLRQYEKEKSFHRAQLMQKEEERQVLARENKSLLEKVDELINSRNCARRRAAVVEKKYEEKISATRELLKELKKHIQVQHNEITTLKAGRPATASSQSTSSEESQASVPLSNLPPFKEGSQSNTKGSNSQNAVVVPDNDNEIQEDDPMPTDTNTLCEEETQEISETHEDPQIEADMIVIEDSQAVYEDSQSVADNCSPLREEEAYPTEESETVQTNDKGQMESSQSVGYDYNQFYGDSQDAADEGEVPLMSIEQYADYTRAQQSYDEDNLSVTQEMDTLLGNK